MKNINIDFIGIGTQKAGTTWLHSNLLKLPEFSLPKIKEVHYFDRENKFPSPGSIGKSRFHGGSYKKIWNSFHVKKSNYQIFKSLVKLDFKYAYWLMNFYNSKYSKEWYLSLFSSMKGFKGEITPGYSMLDIDSIKKMRDVAPHAKLILMIRNPIDRAWSHYRFEKSNLNEGNRDILEFMMSEAQTKRSNYLNTIENYGLIYPKEQILICFYDAITDCPQRLLEEIVHFIGGDMSAVANYTNSSNKVYASRPAECPVEVYDSLKSKYYRQIKESSERFGGYFSL